MLSCVCSPLRVLDRLLGFGIEVIADHQKSSWRALPASKGRYIDVGLWRYSRHPNYFGEWILWVGQFVLCASSWALTGNGANQTGAFVGAGWLCVLSPLFVYFLLNHVRALFCCPPCQVRFILLNPSPRVPAGERCSPAREEVRRALGQRAGLPVLQEGDVGLLPAPDTANVG